MPLDHYTIGKVIGKGSYGEVYLVKHRKDKKQVNCYVQVLILRLIKLKFRSVGKDKLSSFP